MTRAPVEPAAPTATGSEAHTDADADADTDADTDTDTDAGAAARASVRTRLPGRFVTWLEEVLGPEDPPSGLADEIWAAVGDATVGEDDLGDPIDAVGTDLHAVWTAMTALIQEVKLQGRAFARLTGEIQATGPVTEPAAADAMASVQRLAQTLTAEREAALQREGARKVGRETVEGLLDVRDSLVRGLSACRGFLAEGGSATRPAAPPPAPAAVSRLTRAAGQALRDVGRWLDPPPGLASEPEVGQRAQEAAAALEKGCELSLGRLDELLSRHDVREIPCQGERFDPRCMAADDMEESSAVEEPMVVEVYRPGYRQGDVVLRAARVKVARPVARPQQLRRSRRSTQEES